MWMVTFEYSEYTEQANKSDIEANKRFNVIEAYSQTIPCFFLYDTTNIIATRYKCNRKPAKVTIEYREEAVTSETYKKSAVEKLSNLAEANNKKEG